MMITKNNLVFLDNPKCATTVLRYYYAQLRKKDRVIYISPGGFRGDFADPRYQHVNLEGAVRYIEQIGGKVKDFTFFASIRNPYHRMRSWYMHGLNRGFVPGFSPPRKHNGRYLPRTDYAMWTFLNQPGILPAFGAHQFRAFRNHRVQNLIKTESFAEDLKYLSKQYDIGFPLGVKIPHSARNRSTHKTGYPVPLYDKRSVDRINSFFELDFHDGGYVYQTAEELNEEILSKLSEEDKKNTI